MKSIFDIGKKLHVTTYAHNFGFLIPCESGVVWEQQTDGVCCNHEKIEGIFIPLEKPREIKDNGKTGEEYKSRISELLNVLAKANYDYKPTKETDKIWDRIKSTMEIEWDETDAPEGMPCNQEGLQWIKLKRRPAPETRALGAYGIMITETDWYSWINDIAEKPIVLIYPNCD